MHRAVKLKQADLTDQRHLWSFEGATVGQLTYDLGSLRITAWSLNGSIEIRLGAPFQFSDGRIEVDIDFDALDASRLQATLRLLGDEITELHVDADGTMKVLFHSGCEISIGPHPRYEAWELVSEGIHEQFGYMCSPGGGPPWK